MSARHWMALRLAGTPVRGALMWYRHRGLVANDVFLASYPKSGNTWMKFMIGQLLTGGEVDFDSVEGVIPEVGSHRGGPGVVPGGGRLIKTHEAWRPAYQRAVYVVRDARDVAISLYYHYLRQGRIHGTLETFVRAFARGGVDPYGGWRTNVASWLDSPPAVRGAVLVIRYEDMRRAPDAALRRTMEFLGIPTPDSRIADAIARNRADRMRDKEAQSTVVIRPDRRDIPFVRKGQIGEWKETLDARDQALLTDSFRDLLVRLGYDA